MRLTYAVALPPVLVAVMVNIVRTSSSSGVPLMVPVAVSNTRPDGRLGLMVQASTVPEPVTVGASGKSLLAVLLVSCRSLGM